MFGFGQKRKEKDLETLTYAWMGASFLGIDTNLWKSDNKRFRFVLAYLLGPTVKLGGDSGFSQSVTLNIFLRCIEKHMHLSQSEVQRTAQTICDLFADRKNAKIMQFGIKAQDQWFQLGGRIIASSILIDLFDQYLKAEAAE